ncbi:MAG: hypothetical protein KFW21_02580 [Spirochaetota bacterium]|nr:hypothetical protein [Spirochaetota bacterium]
MKKYNLLIITLLIATSSCAIEGEVYRLQTRIKYWHQLLNNTEEQMFAQNKINELGLILDQKEADDLYFKQKIREVRINEAIMSFDGAQTVHFFYNVLLKDLAKFSYEEFMRSLSEEEQIQFIQKNLPDTIFVAKKSVFNNARKDFGFNSFTDEEILTYYRSISFPANYYVVVYDILVFLAKYRSMDLFLQGDLTGTVDIFNSIKKLETSKSVSVRKQAKQDLELWNDFKKRTFLTSLSNKEFAQVLSIVLPEMDTTVRIQTIDNIKNRFKEE